ncbi:MFS transporter [Streptomyces albireticuli]|uniref:MFS transporter n=1 Tax=Streptomyces albireticuli TaxID=1940 RepID=A0A2A2DEP7_9ACTN|nr:MFS transporter [Streptomyces albireticuli]MCD9194720.1 MFS transporter [Streptomyces albireticuli]PAU49927.1 MFS transporter [Streptomyces albireticuli]
MTGGRVVRRPGIVLAVVSCAVFMAMLDNLVVNNALPSIGEELDTSVSGLQWVVAGYTLVFAATLLSASVVGDRLGQRRAFFTGLGAFMAGSALGSVATGQGLLVAGRGIQGLGAAVLLPAGTALLRHTYTDDAGRARAIGVRGAVGGLGIALGPVIGGPLVEALGWRSVMWINLPVGLAALLVGLRVLPRPPAAPVRWDPAGQALAVTGLGSLVHALIQGPVDGWRTPPVVACLALAAVALTAFGAVEARGARPMLDPALFRARASRAAAVSCFASGLALFGATFFLTFYLQNILGWSAAGAGAVFLSASVFIAFTSPLAGVLTGRYGARPPLVLGLVLSALALAGLSRYGRGAAFADYGWLLPVLGAGTGLLFVPTMITMVQGAPAAHAGTASAVVDTLREVGGVVGVAALGAVLTTRMRTTLYERTARAGLPHDAVEDLVRTAVADGPVHRLGAGRPGAGPPLARVWMEESFVDGLRLALRCGALVLVCALVVVLVLLWGRRPPAATLPAVPERRGELKR